MPFSIPKINVGKSKNKTNKMFMPVDVNTSCDFGSMQPLVQRLLVPGTKMELNLKNALVRMGTLPVPTFGRISYNIYSQFVPLADLYRPFDNLLSQTKYSTSVKEYVPSSIPYIRICTLTRFLLDGAYGSLFYSSSAWSSNNSVQFKAQPYLALQTQYQTMLDSFFKVSNYGFSLKAPSFEYDSSGNCLPNAYPESCDYLLQTSKSITGCPTGYSNTLCCLKFTNRQKRFRKILIGLGYKLDLSNTRPVSILPLIAYYKAWWDLFAPKQNGTTVVNWQSTNAFKLMDLISENDYYNVGDYVVPTASTSALKTVFTAFLNDLIDDCFYYQPADFISAHTQTAFVNNANPSPQIFPEQTASFNPLTLDANSEPRIKASLEGKAYPVAEEEYSQLSGVAWLNPMSLKLLQRMLQYVSKDSVIGGRLREWMKVHYGSDAITDIRSNFIGAAHVNCNIGGIFNTAESSEAALGQYAGVGLGKLENKKFTFTASVFGYWITMACVVPDAGRYQGIDNTLSCLTKWQFYTPELDGLGYDLTSKDIVQGSGWFFGDTSTGSRVDKNYQAFGYIPRYSMFKVAQNCVNGDLSLPSLRDQMSSYYLDNQITGDHVVLSSDNRDSSSVASYTMLRESLPVATPQYRVIGKYPWLGNFDRIFNQGISQTVQNDSMLKDADQFVTDDNFFVNNEFEITLYTPMLPISDSYDTDGFSNAISLDKQ